MYAKTFEDWNDRVFPNRFNESIRFELKNISFMFIYVLHRKLEISFSCNKTFFFNRQVRIYQEHSNEALFIVKTGKNFKISRGYCSQLIDGN